MILRITAGALAASAITVLPLILLANPATACNRMDGCIHDSQLESYGMMHDGRMGVAIRDGAANVEAFREMGTTAARQEQPRAGPRKRSTSLSAR